MLTVTGSAMPARSGVTVRVGSISNGELRTIEPAVNRMVEACREGPFGAGVADVAVSDAADDGSVGFTPKPTL